MNNLRIYRFQTKVKTNSVNDLLAKFLKAKDGDLTERERVWLAVSAFWLPIAMKESDSYSSEEIARYGLSAIQRLQQQIAHLTLVLNLEVPTLSPLSHCSTSLTNHLPAQREGQVKPYTQIDGLEAQDIYNQEQSLEADNLPNLTNLEKIAFSSDTSQIDKLFGIE